MIVGVYGIGYACAASDPLRHWPIVLVGLLGKLFGPLGFLMAVLKGELPWRFGALLLTNDLIWWVPFGLILYHAVLQQRNRTT
jgi:small multidrug resistance pump